MTPPVPARSPEPATSGGVRHLWVAAGHSLCELETADGDAEVLEALDARAAVCGPCLLIVGRLRRQACAFLELSAGEVVPRSPSESWRLLDKSPWARRMDVKAFLRANPDVDERTRYEAIGYEVDPSSVDELVAEVVALRAAARR